MPVRWVVRNLAGQRIGDLLVAATKSDAYDRACALHGAACHQVQSLLAWEEEARERQAEDRNRRMYPRLSEEDR